MSATPRVTELEFVFEADGFALGRAATAAGTGLEVKLFVPRSDGTVLAFVEPERRVKSLVDHLETEPRIHQVRRLEREDAGPLVELVMDGHPVTTLADRGVVVTRVAAASGQGRVVADVPPPVEVSPVIAAFTLAHPSVRLVGKREVDRRVPQLGQSQFVTRVLTRFTARQLAALRTAYEHGYFEWPRDHKAAEVADELGVSTPTFSQHIRAAERKLTELLFEG